MNNKIYTIDEIKDILKEILYDEPVYKIILFGSYAKNSANVNSDLDVVVDTNSKLKGFALLKLISKIEERFGKNVDGFEKYEIIDESPIDIEIKKQGWQFMKNKEYTSLKKMIQYIDKALQYVENVTFEDFSKNDEKIYATVFAISQIGELAKNVSDETMKKYNNIESLRVTFPDACIATIIMVQYVYNK